MPIRARTGGSPRQGGVAIPASLVRVGAPAQGGHAAVVDWLGRSLRQLPEELLATPFPGPGEIIAAWRLGARTRRALAQIEEKKSAWSLRDYLHRPRMGAASIVDLLAAREENVPCGASRVSPRVIESLARPRGVLTDRLAELTAFFRRHLPVRAQALGDLLVSAGLATGPLSVGDVLRTYRDRGLPVPFRIVRRGGGATAVAPSGLATAEAVFAAAAHLVMHWGVCTLDAVRDRLRSLSAPDLSPGAMSRVLDALPHLRWLDQQAGWFSLAGCTGRVGLAIRKVLGVAERVPVQELVAAIGKRVKVFAAAPPAAVEAYLVDIAGCEIADGFVQAGARFVPVTVDSVERAIVDAINRMGGDLTIRCRRALAATAGVSLRVINDFLRTSPFVIADGKGLRLAGIPRALPAL